MENKVDKEAILKKAMNKKYCSKTRFDFLDDEELLMIYSAMESYSASQNSELKKENEELKERVINLQQADMTHEYNNAEAARVWPQIEEQIREDEREKLESTIIEKDKELVKLNDAYNEIYKQANEWKNYCELNLQSKIAEQQRTIYDLRDIFETIFLLCEENGKPVDGYRFRELIIAAKSLLSKHNSKNNE